MTALECSTSGKKARFGEKCPLADGQLDHESGEGSPHFPTDLHQNRRGGRLEGSSSICNWLWPIRWVAPFCTEPGSAHRRESLRLQHSLTENAFITYPPPIPALMRTLPPQASVLYPKCTCCNVVCDHGFPFFSRTMQVVKVLQAKSSDKTVIEEGSAHSSNYPLSVGNGIERALYMYSKHKARPRKDYTSYQFILHSIDSVSTTDRIHLPVHLTHLAGIY